MVEFVTLDVRIAAVVPEPWDLGLAAKVLLIVALLLLSGTFSGEYPLHNGPPTGHPPHAIACFRRHVWGCSAPLLIDN